MATRTTLGNQSKRKGMFLWVLILGVGLPLLVAVVKAPAHGTPRRPTGPSSHPPAMPAWELTAGELEPIDLEEELDVESEAYAGSEETGYAVVCCGMGDPPSCNYYVGQTKCPGGTFSMTCPCRQMVSSDPTE